MSDGQQPTESWSCLKVGDFFFLISFCAFFFFSFCIEQPFKFDQAQEGRNRKGKQEETDMMTKDAPACAPATDGLSKHSILIHMMCLRVHSQYPGKCAEFKHM